jgi:hypothetical protein
MVRRQKTKRPTYYERAVKSHFNVQRNYCRLVLDIVDFVVS